MLDAGAMRREFTPPVVRFKRESGLPRKFFNDTCPGRKTCVRMSSHYRCALMIKSVQPGDSENAASIAAAVQRLGRNLGGYFGEGIEIDAVMAEQRECARAHGWQLGTIRVGDGLELPVFQRQVPRPVQRLYISTGIHGDEPAGPLAVRELLKENPWPDHVEIWLCPCLNPTGFPRGTRESNAGVDLNRDYRHLRTPEVRAHVAWLEKQPRFDLCLCLHEDWEAQGFYVYEVNPDGLPSLASAMVEAARAVCPIDHSTIIDGRDARDGIIRPILDPALRPEWPEAFYLFMNKTRLSYTLEAPSDFPLTVRVTALVAATKAALMQFAGKPTYAAGSGDAT
jgi:protein MpaA